MVDKFSDGSNCQYTASPVVTAYPPCCYQTVYSYTVVCWPGNHTDSSISHPEVIAVESPDELNCQKKPNCQYSVLLPATSPLGYSCAEQPVCWWNHTASFNSHPDTQDQKLLLKHLVIIPIVRRYTILPLASWSHTESMLQLYTPFFSGSYALHSSHNMF